VLVKEQVSGPAATLGKFVTVKYTGRYFRTDSVFQSSQFTFPVGKYQVISGWDEGVLAFNQGGKGILYIPGFRAYGKTPPPNAAFAPYEPLIFDIEVMSVSDTMPSTENKTRPMKKLTRQKQ
jgi:FKBP-type peptidyl-prolyl cis-trans isomerase